MAPPASSARALHDILQAVTEHIGGSNKAYRAWRDVAGEEIESTEFAQFHAEAVALLSEVAAGMGTLDTRSRERYLQYLPAWWNGVVRPRQDWAAIQDPIIDKANLDMLAALADLQETRALLAEPGNPQAAEVLTRAVTHILSVVQQATDIPHPVRDQIVADLEHVLWLLSHVDTFGVDHAVAAVERATGKVTAAATKTRSQRLKEAAVGLTAALAFSATATTNVTTIVENVQSVFGISAEADPGGINESVQSTVLEIYTVCAPKALAPGPTTSDNSAVDAEIVDDDDKDEAAGG